MNPSNTKSMLLVVGLIFWGGAGFGTSVARAQGYAVQSPRAYYYPVAGRWNTTSGMVWVPAAGYYHVVPVQFYPAGEVYPRSAAVWRPHPAPTPGRRIKGPRGGIPAQVYVDGYWYGKVANTFAEHNAWVRQQQELARAVR